MLEEPKVNYKRTESTYEYILILVPLAWAEIGELELNLT